MIHLNFISREEGEKRLRDDETRRAMILECKRKISLAGKGTKRRAMLEDGLSEMCAIKNTVRESEIKGRIFKFLNTFQESALVWRDTLSKAALKGSFDQLGRWELGVAIRDETMAKLGMKAKEHLEQIPLSEWEELIRNYIEAGRDMAVREAPLPNSNYWVTAADVTKHTAAVKFLATSEGMGYVLEILQSYDGCYVMVE